MCIVCSVSCGESAGLNTRFPKPVSSDKHSHCFRLTGNNTSAVCVAPDTFNHLVKYGGPSMVKYGGPSMDSVI